MILKNRSIVQNLVAGVLLVLLLFFSWGCSTQKNALPNRLYHSINAKYNGYFNARESYREAMDRLSDSHTDNYEQVLSIFRYGNEQQAGSVAGNMDVAYQKASTVIRKHSMNIRGVEYNPWIEKSFYLIARSHYFKRDFNLAVLTFEYMAKQYDSQIKYLAKAWIAKSYHQLERYDDAFAMLELLGQDHVEGLLDKESERLYYLVMADHFIRTGDYLAAIPYLNQGATLTGSKSERARLTFIQAQLYHHSGDYANAQQTYANVLKMNPSFELAFQSRIRMAMAYDPGEGGGDYIESELKQMLRDDKNRAYRDQIYYALAQLYLRRGLEDEAIELLVESTEVSEENRLQKGLSFLRLGEIFFSRPEYLEASIYYDSAVVFIPSQHDYFPEANQQRTVLSTLATNIRVIEREDSLQQLAAMPESERMAIVDKIIEDLREEERQAKLIEQQMMRAASTIAQTRLRGGVGAQDGGWYFYNTTAMSFGRTEFFSKFGDRPLEDLWRISNKRTSGDFDMAMDDELEDEEEMGDVFDRNTYLKNIPVTDEQMEASSMKIANAYYNMAMTFNDQLNDYHSAIESLESLITRYPESERKLYAFYYLYNLYREIGDPSRADMYKDRLLAEFPDSEFADILGDPNYLEKLTDRQQYGKSLYQEAYRSFLNNQYQDVIDKSRLADSLDLSRSIQSQFAYIKALSIGKLGRKSEFKQELAYVVDNYDGMAVHEPASFLLASLDTPGSLPIDFEEEEEEEGIVVAQTDEVGLNEIFTFSAEAVHFFVLVAETNDAGIVRLVEMINAFNESEYPDNRLSASSIFFDDKRQIITVTNFPDKDAGMEYYDALTALDGLSGANADAINSFVISVNNYPVFYQEKNLDEYITFFTRYYLEE